MPQQISAALNVANFVAQHTNSFIMKSVLKIVKGMYLNEFWYYQAFLL
jgi:hypothetical protein